MKFMFFVWRIKILCLGFKCLLIAWWIKFRNTMQNVKFPNTVESKNKLAKKRDRVISCADFFVKYGTFNTGRKCFFRSYIMGYLLRKEGFPVIMNIGVSSNKNIRKVRGHCWLTLNDQPFAERRDPSSVFPVDMGYGQNGIRYWTDDIRTETAMGEKWAIQ